MWRKKSDFKPDRIGSGFLNKLYLTQRQRMKQLKWALYSVVLLVLSLLQDVILCRISIFGTNTDLFVSGMLLLCMMVPVDTSAVFALISAVFYYFSGAAPGTYSIFFLTGLGVLLNIFRYSYLRKGFGSAMLCAVTALMLYELLVYITGVFLGYTTAARFGAFCVTGLISAAAMPILYPIYVSIGKIGGESWKE